MVFTEELMNPLFDFLERCKGVEQKDEWHPEGDVFEHSIQVMWKAFKETDDTDLILAAMLHDIGKYENSKGHEKLAVEWLKDYLSEKSLWLIENHMRIWYLLLGDMKKFSKVKELVNHPWLPELVLLIRWDKMGRNPNWKPEYDRQLIVDRLNNCGMKRFRV